MNKQDRINKLKVIKSNKDKINGSKKLNYENKKGEVFLAYNIPVEYLIFNQYNGRIGTFVKTYEKQKSTIDATTEGGEKLIVDFLWKSKENRNKETLEDIKEKGQLEVGIVTADGVIIDGNRRCMLLKKIAEKNHSTPTYFIAVILPDTLEDNPREIKKLETIYQMGVDAKVDYNPIEKYLKVRDLEKEGFTKEEIAKMMGEEKAKIEKYSNILILMENYLEYIGYKEMYTILNGLGKKSDEGYLWDLQGYLKTQKEGKRIRNRNWKPANDDFDDLQCIYFDYIRSKIPSAELRRICNPSKENDKQGIFNNKDLWKKFSEKHFEKKETIEEKSLDELLEENPNGDLDDIITTRELEWRKTVESDFKSNYGKTLRDLDDSNSADQPIELLERIEKLLFKIDPDSEGFNEDCLEKIKSINKKGWELKKLLE